MSNITIPKGKPSAGLGGVPFWCEKLTTCSLSFDKKCGILLTLLFTGVIRNKCLEYPELFALLILHLQPWNNDDYHNIAIHE